MAQKRKGLWKMINGEAEKQKEQKEEKENRRGKSKQEKTKIRAVKQYNHREQFVRWVSCVHRIYNLKIQSFVLAIHIYDRIVQNPRFNVCKLMMLCCLMLATKFEQIYPPSLYSLADLLKINIIIGAYIKLQTTIFEQLSYDIIIQQPNHLINLHPEHKQHFNLFIEIALWKFSSQQICWKEVVGGIKIIFTPLTQKLKGYNQMENHWAKLLQIERARLEENYPEIWNKYSRQQYNSVALKTFWPTHQ